MFFASSFCLPGFVDFSGGDTLCFVIRNEGKLVPREEFNSPRVV